MPNQWLAIDVATAPAQRARELRDAWESFVVGPERFSADADGWSVREPIAASWGAAPPPGVDPSGRQVAPVVADADEASARWEIHPLAQMAPLIRACLAASADESRHLIVVSDANGVLLWVEGNATVRMRAAESMNFAEGTLWSEGGSGHQRAGGGPSRPDPDRARSRDPGHRHRGSTRTAGQALEQSRGDPRRRRHRT